MEISQGVYIGLAASLGVALVMMIVAFVWMHVKTKKIKNQYANSNLKKINQTPRENFGKLLWELKNNSTNPLDDAQMEYIINTAYINKYKTFKTYNFNSNYESQSLKELINLKLVNINPDLVVINAVDDYDKIFDQEFKKMQVKKMIILTNANRKAKEIKNTINYLRLIKAKYEWQNYGKGIILVVK